mmetsp:Transcript_42128/g.54244  ORF Transcript_42128/g.54244 Transcript_42128/m.54244 type:complete len:398 (+) Transcript_42128:123-1316(+)
MADNIDALDKFISLSNCSLSDDVINENSLTSTEHYVFVYGSLLSGSDEMFGNHQHYLKNLNNNDQSNVAAAEDSSLNSFPTALKVGDGITEFPNFIMLSQEYDSYPYVIDASDLMLSQNKQMETTSSSSLSSSGVNVTEPIGMTLTQIKGEVWKVNDQTLDRLDSLEGHPTYYCRRKVSILMENTNADHVQVYASSVENVQLPPLTPLAKPNPTSSFRSSSNGSSSSSPYTPTKTRKSPPHRKLNRSLSACSPSSFQQNSQLSEGSTSAPTTPMSQNMKKTRQKMSSSKNQPITSLRKNSKASTPSPTPSPSMLTPSTPSPSIVKDRFISVHMYLLVKKSKIDSFVSTFLERNKNNQDNPMVEKEKVDKKKYVLSNNVFEVTPLGDWRSYRIRSFKE